MLQKQIDYGVVERTMERIRLPNKVIVKHKIHAGDMPDIWDVLTPIGAFALIAVMYFAGCLFGGGV